MTDRPTLTREALIDAALRLLDEVGLDGLSVRRLAADLGVRSPALYWHIRTKQELLDGIADRIVGAAGVGPPHPGEDWPGWLTRRARAYREALRAHRDTARVVTGARALAPETLRAVDRELAAMVAHGFTPTLALRTITALTCFVNGFVLQEQLTATRPPARDPALHDDLVALLGPDAPLLAAFPGQTDPLGDEAFEHGLRSLVTGAASALAELNAPTSATAPGPTSTTRLRVRPRHCDAKGTVHAARYYEFVEDAVADWLDEHARGFHGRLGIELVVVSSGCEYRGPARLDDDLVVECAPVGAVRTSLTMECTVRRAADVLAVGRVSYVCVRDGVRVPVPSELGLSGV